MTKKVGDGYGITSFVMAIIGLFLFWIPLFGVIFPVLAIVFAVKQRKIKHTGLSTTGLVMGIIEAVIVGLFLLFILIAFLMVIFEGIFV